MRKQTKVFPNQYVDPYNLSMKTCNRENEAIKIV